MQFKHRRYQLLEEQTDEGMVAVSLPAVNLRAVAATRGMASMMLKKQLRLAVKRMQAGTVPVPPSDAVPTEGYMIVEIFGAEMHDEW
jgi:hypothetical protein